MHSDEDPSADELVELKVMDVALLANLGRVDDKEHMVG